VSINSSSTEKPEEAQRSWNAAGRGRHSRFGVALLAIQAVVLLPRCEGDSDFLDHGAAGDESSAGANEAGVMNRGGGGGAAAGRGGAGRGGSGRGGSGGEAGGGEAASGGEHFGGQSSSGGEGPGGQGSGGRESAGEGGQGANGGLAGAAGESAAGAASGGAGAGGSASGAGAGGEAGEASVLRPDFMLGADISSVHEAIELGASFVDTDGEVKPIAGVLAAHGFNFIRLRTFVAPMNLYGYANPNGNPAYVREEAYCDRDHTVEFGKQMKDAGMKLLVDLHYSDNWADPGKQIIPEAWRGVQSIEELGANVRSYTQDLVQTMVDAGARPDIVQLGNEIAPGMLIHVPSDTPNADQWGNMNMDVNPINGASSNWTNLGLLLREGVAGVQAVDPSIRIMVHLANTTSPSAVIAWVNAARAQGVDLDIVGLSCYTQWHGQPVAWEHTFRTVAAAVPDLDFVIAEYGPEARRANEIMRDLPDQRGLGSFVWEPTVSGSWGPSMFSYSADTYEALSPAFAIYDGIRADFGLP
jgi:arabinogalactan endo-1,4-beta-galactosidase